MVEPSLKEVVKAMCKAYPGGREAMAGALGMSVTQFNNNLYEKNGCRFFDNDELEAMEDLTKTRHLVEYHMDRHGMTPMPDVSPEDIDKVELFDIRMTLSALRADLELHIDKSLKDGKLTREEVRGMYKKSGKVFAYFLGFVGSLDAVFGVPDEK